jgi:hypothetical protein
VSHHLISRSPMPPMTVAAIAQSKLDSTRASLAATHYKIGQIDNQIDNVVLVDAPFLSPGLVDLLQDSGHDWICALQPEWVVEHQRWAGLQPTLAIARSPIECSTVQDYVAALQAEHYEWVRLAVATYQVHTCCLHVIGMGRVRMVVVADDRGGDRHWVLVTNRLGWSPRYILNHWLQMLG